MNSFGAKIGSFAGDSANYIAHRYIKTPRMLKAIDKVKDGDLPSLEQALENAKLYREIYQRIYGLMADKKFQPPKAPFPLETKEAKIKRRRNMENGAKIRLSELWANGRFKKVLKDAGLYEIKRSFYTSRAPAKLIAMAQLAGEYFDVVDRAACRLPLAEKRTEGNERLRKEYAAFAGDIYKRYRIELNNMRMIAPERLPKWTPEKVSPFMIYEYGKDNAIAISKALAAGMDPSAIEAMVKPPSVTATNVRKRSANSGTRKKQVPTKTVAAAQSPINVTVKKQRAYNATIQ